MQVLMARLFRHVILPAKIVEMWRPLLIAWLKSKRVWISDTNGNTDKTAIGMKIMSPIMYSHAIASSFIDSQAPIALKNGLFACPI